MIDLISRQAAIDAIVNTVSEIGLHDNSEVARYGATFRQHEIIYIIESLPSAQPERKKGRWAEFDSDEDKFDIIKCSCCKHTFTVDSYHWTDIGFVKDDFNFCPNCGADMRGGENETD